MSFGFTKSKLADNVAETNTSIIANFYSQFISSGDLVFDIGANVGRRTEIFSHMARKVVAVEPQLGLITRLNVIPNVVIVEKACGAREGQAEMFIASLPETEPSSSSEWWVNSCSAISSLSTDWIAAVKKTNRFEDRNWDRRRLVPVTTLDALIQEHGTPAFIKIDVEGYEDVVLQGLTHAIKALSFEFTPEHSASAMRSVGRLCMLGNYQFNYDTRETFHLQGSWVGADTLLSQLSRFQGDRVTYGDVYARSV